MIEDNDGVKAAGVEVFVIVNVNVFGFWRGRGRLVVVCIGDFDLVKLFGNLEAPV